jgi:hypothetical protein
MDDARERGENLGRINGRGWIRYAHHKFFEKIQHVSLENERQVKENEIN